MMTTPDFSRWAAACSQRTNRSLAGSRLIGVPEHRADTAWQQFCEQAQQWGMITDSPSADTNQPASSSTLIDCRIPAADIPDARQLNGAAAMDYAQHYMPVMQAVLAQVAQHQQLKGLRIAVCLVLEPKTAVLLRCLQQAGAQVGIYCAPEDTDARVVEQLRREGILVEADPSWSTAQSRDGALRLLDALNPQIIIDDGASFARLAARERPQIAAQLIGVAEETTSGIRAFTKMEHAGELPFPVVASNNSPLKTDFDNRHGTGETCVTTLQDIFGAHVFEGKSVAVIGYGPVGQGFAERIRALGAHVTICEANPIVALQAVFNGFDAQDLSQVLPHADLVISATGERHTITLDHLRAMNEGTIVSVIGGVANEIALDTVAGWTHVTHERTTTLTIPDGPTITVVAGGDGVNYTVGGGNPIDIMDLSFAVQIGALDYLLTEQHQLERRVITLPDSYNQRIAQQALAVRGASVSARAEQIAPWTITRFDE